MSDDVSTHTRSIPVEGGTIDLSWASITHRGRRRESNQDALLAQFPIFAVADGMGGHIGGEIASTSVIARLREAADDAVTIEAIEHALEQAAADIASRPEATDDGTGTTVTGVFLDDTGPTPHWVTLNVGDSRVYLIRDLTIEQVTTDHSVVQELIAAGRLSPDEAENHPYGNVITRAVGPTAGVVPDYVRFEARDGDRFVVCSDGLTKELTDFGIQHFVAEHPDPAQAVTEMLTAALENGGRDNISIIVVRVEAPGLDDGEHDDSSPTAEKA